MTEERARDLTCQELSFHDDINNIFIECPILHPAEDRRLSSVINRPNFFGHIRLLSSIEVQTTRKDVPPDVIQSMLL